MHIRDALDQISDIRSQLAQTLTFRGYRSVTTAFTGFVAIAAACVQSIWLGDGMNDLHLYLRIWLAAAILSLIVVGIEIIWRSVHSGRALQRELSLAAIEQFTPTLVAGALLTYVLIHAGGENAWLLPGLWMILFAMGVFASRRLLPRSVFAVGAYYLLAGLSVLLMDRGAQLAPWVMGAAFGFGQMFAAIILYFSLERGRVSE
ncbi:hypothetical protein BH09PLA1_BH09PLA1_32930 [soil metagenome]